jgi:hypothetical protein
MVSKSCVQRHCHLSFFQIQVNSPTLFLLFLNYVMTIHLFIRSFITSAVQQINDKLSWTFRCDLCGRQECNLDGFPQELDISFEMPDCQEDSASSSMQGSLSVALTSQSPTKGWIPMALKGTLEVYSHPNELLAQIGMNATIA